jgi:hypothetical protein
MIILLKASSFLMHRAVLVVNVGVSLVRCRCLWLPCCILFWVSCCDVLTRDFAYYFWSYMYLNVFGCVFIGSCYVFLMGFFPRSVPWRWCMCCWERCLSTVCCLLFDWYTRNRMHNHKVKLVWPCQHLRGTRQPFTSGFGPIVVVQHECSPHNTGSTAQGEARIRKQPSSQSLPVRLPARDTERAMTGWQISQPAESRMGQTTQRVCLLRIKCNLGKRMTEFLNYLGPMMSILMYDSAF